jgi:transposase
MVAADERTAIIFSLSGGEKHDAPEGRNLIEQLKVSKFDSSLTEGEKHDLPTDHKLTEQLKVSLLMDRAYEDDKTRTLAVEVGLTPVVPPKKNRLEPWDYDKELYKRRNEVERLFRRIKGFRRVFTRYEKLDVMYLAFLTFALIVDALK